MGNGGRKEEKRASLLFSTTLRYSAAYQSNWGLEGLVTLAKYSGIMTYEKQHNRTAGQLVVGRMGEALDRASLVGDG